MKRIVLATGLDPDDRDVFATGLAIARKVHAPLQMIHVHNHDQSPGWDNFPTVRALLEKWDVLSPNATVDDFTRLGIKVRPMDFDSHGSPVVELVVRIQAADPDLLIIGTEGRVGFDRLLHPSLAEAVVRRAGHPALVINHRGRGIIDASGNVKIRNVLVPIDIGAPQQIVIDTLARLFHELDLTQVAFTLFHVGSFEGVPALNLPPQKDWSWRTQLFDGDVVEGILNLAAMENVDLIAMATQGHDSWLDTIAGSTTEQVIRRAPCTVLAVPVP